MKRKLGMNSDCYEGMPEEIMLELIKEAGFHSFFTDSKDLAKNSSVEKKGR